MCEYDCLVLSVAVKPPALKLGMGFAPAYLRIHADAANVTEQAVSAIMSFRCNATRIT